MPLPPSRFGIVLAAAAVVLLAGGGAVWADHRHERGDLVEKVEAMTGGNVERGRAAFSSYGCGGCHSVGGVPQAKGKVGPPLDGVGGRAIIGGRLENRPANLMRWIQDPQGVSPGTGMPRLGVSREDARDIAAFLYTKT